MPQKWGIVEVGLTVDCEFDELGDGLTDAVLGFAEVLALVLRGDVVQNEGSVRVEPGSKDCQFDEATMVQLINSLHDCVID